MSEANSGSLPRRSFFGESRMPLQRTRHTVSRSATASESAVASGGSGHSVMGATVAIPVS